MEVLSLGSLDLRMGISQVVNSGNLNFFLIIKTRSPVVHRVINNLCNVCNGTASYGEQQFTIENCEDKFNCSIGTRAWSRIELTSVEDGSEQ